MSDDEQRFLAQMKRLSEASSEEKAEMTEEDVYAMAVNVVAERIQKDGATLKLVDASRRPSIWCEVNEEALYVLVTVVRYPEKLEIPKDIEEVVEQINTDRRGFWVGVSLAHELEAFDPEYDGASLPLMKNFGVLANCSAFIPLSELVREK